MPVAVTFVLLIAGCGLVPETVTHDDPRLKPFFAAMKEVDRASLGFTAVATNANIRLELGSGKLYDAMLHVYQDTRRTIAFRKVNSEYRWIGEQESHEGPEWNQTIDGNFREYITIEVQTERVNGISTNQLWIRYSGPDRALEWRELTLEEVRPLLSRWKTAEAQHEPPLLPGGGFDPAPAFALMFFLISALLVLVIAFVLLAVGGVVLGAMMLLGIISTSAIAALLLKSPSAGAKMFAYQTAAAAGTGTGLLACAVVPIFWHVDSPNVIDWLLAASGGLAVGTAITWLFLRSCSLFARRFGRHRPSSTD